MEAGSEARHTLMELPSVVVSSAAAVSEAAVVSAVSAEVLSVVAAVSVEAAGAEV